MELEWRLKVRSKTLVIRMRNESDPKREKVFLAEDGVRITSTRAILGGKTYALRNISSVSLEEIPADTATANAMILWGLILSLCTCGLTLILSIIGAVMLSNAKPSYAVRLASNAGEHHALISNDQEQIEAIVKAIEEAMIAYG